MADSYEAKATFTNGIKQAGQTSAAPLIATRDGQAALNDVTQGFATGVCGRLSAVFMTAHGSKEFAGLDFKQTPFGPAASGAMSFGMMSDIANLLKAGVDARNTTPVVSTDSVAREVSTPDRESRMFVTALPVACPPGQNR